jgi:hypothetical protein
MLMSFLPQYENHRELTQHHAKYFLQKGESGEFQDGG